MMIWPKRLSASLRWTVGVFGVISGCLWVDAQSAFAAGRPRPPSRWTMGVIGDSISAATFADISIHSTEPDEWDRFGDWIRSGFQSDFLIHNRESLSWASGSRIQSHRALLQAALESQGFSGTLEAINLAEPGATAADSLTQATRLVEQVRTGNSEGLLYVTYFIGANDACSDKTPTGTPNDKMRASLFATLQKLATLGSPARPVRVLMAALPRIPDLGTQAIRNHSTILGLKCQELRGDFLNFCTPLLNWRNDAEYAARVRIVEDKNSLLREVALDASKRFPELEVAFSERPFNHEIDLDELAADCFHPGRSGQERLARELWQDQPWY